MKKIRIKVKTLIIVLVSIVIIFGLVLPKIMFNISDYISEKDREKAIKFYNVYLGKKMKHYIIWLLLWYQV